MRIVIIGAGEVGSNIAASLCEAHEVVVIDIDKSKIDSLTYSIDVLAIKGDGATLDTLQEAGVEEADIVIASTDDDETNIVACGTAKTLSDAFTIARVTRTKFFRTWESSRGSLGVDYMVGTNLLTAQTIVRIIGLPAARDVDVFAGGTVQVADFEIPEGSPIANQTVREADRFDSLTFAAVLRNGDVEIPRGNTTINVNDHVVVIGAPGSVQDFASTVAPEQVQSGVDDIVVFGGSETGYQTARLLESRGLKPRLIEQDPERARELAEELPNTFVLERENVDEADVVVSALDTDEKNLLTSLLIKRLGAGRTIAVVDNGKYVDLFEAIGVDVAVNPRQVTAEEITRFTRERRTEKVALIGGEDAEVLEIEVDSDSILANREIHDAVQDLPQGVVIGAITRDSQFITPRGNTEIQVGDHVVVFVHSEVLDEVSSKI
ncbi:MAG: Trk system potassium transporter TrkA [Halobacteria archaeon]|nr:Trk system potassium transporter TrkA [Halobacteria archaeon]